MHLEPGMSFNESHGIQKKKAIVNAVELMKFNRTQTTNQRIERITMQTVVVEIDITKEVHAAQATDFQGRALTPRHLLFTNESVALRSCEMGPDVGGSRS